MRAELFSRLSIFSIVSFFVLWTVLPVVWIFIMSVQPEINYILVPPRLRWVDVSPRWYLELLAQPEVALSLFNSFVVSISVTVLCLVFGALGAYPLARLNLPGKNIFLSLSIVSRMIPSMVLIIPIFLLLRTTGLLDTRLGLISLHSTSPSICIMDAQKLSGASPTRFRSCCVDGWLYPFGRPFPSHDTSNCSWGCSNWCICIYRRLE